MKILDCLDSKTTTTIILSVASVCSGFNNLSQTTTSTQDIKNTDYFTQRSILHISSDNNISNLIDNMTNVTMIHQNKLLEFYSKRDKIISDNTIDSKLKGRLIYALSKKYLTDRVIENDEIFKDELKYFEYMRP